MMTDADKERLEMMDTLEEILPFDDEYSSVPMIGSNDYVMVENFGFYNPVAEAYYNHKKQQVFLYFKFCPIADYGTKVKFVANNADDAMKKTYQLIDMIMKETMKNVRSQDVFKFVALKKAELKEGAGIERHALGEVG